MNIIRCSVIVFILVAPKTINAFFELTNVQCLTYDKSFGDFEYCYLKSINRSYKYFSIKVNFYQLPIDNITANFSLNKRANGYKPFLYNVTVDVCKFLKNPSNPVVGYFFQILRDYSNANHSCPYNHDIILDKVDIQYLNNRFTNVLPMPDGDYGFFVIWSMYNKLRAKVNIYFKISY